MIEHIPQRVESALLYFHSAGTSSVELSPFMPKLIAELPATYIWAGDGVIAESSHMNGAACYGNSERRYWFMFPMQDTSSLENFRRNSVAMGASLLSAGAHVNHTVDMLLERFDMPAKQVVLCGFQHGSCIALAAAMMRRRDPFSKIVLVQPFILESYYLERELIQENTLVVCVENRQMRKRARDWYKVDTCVEFRKMKMSAKSIVTDGDEEQLDMNLVSATIKAVRER